MKTLKDLSEITIWVENNEYEIRYGDYKDKAPTPESTDVLIEKQSLRTAAIEWIRKLENEQDKRFHIEDGTIDKTMEKFFMDTYIADNVVAWIKHFFNITEEDLE